VSKSSRQEVEIMPGSTHHQILIVGGGTAGITVSAILKRRAMGINLAIVEPEHDHYYQPAFTLVGAGVYPLARTRRTEESLIPVGVQWIKNGDTLTYDYLVVCTGVKLDWGKIAGLRRLSARMGCAATTHPSM
jgi:sulfide:quinone oxidoreductase